jgi:hypothetical protein
VKPSTDPSRKARSDQGGARPARPAGVLVSTLLALLLAAGCSPDFSVGPVGDSGAARERLSAALAEGPVRARIFGDPFGLDPDRQDILVTSAIADGVTGLTVRFSTDPGVAPRPEPHLVVLLNPVTDLPAKLACEAPEQVRTGPGRSALFILAAFCEDQVLINAARGSSPLDGPTDPRLKRLFWQTGAVLFPDDYEQTYGIDLIPGLDIGLGGSFGF